LAVFPVAVVPLWHEVQLPDTCVWSTREAGFHAVTTWHDSQLFVVRMCVVFLPVERTPSWQLTQLVEMPVWSNRAGFHAVVAWQLSHSAVVMM